MTTHTRRGFLGTAVGALGSGLLAGCTDKLPRFLVPYAVQPDDGVPGLATFYRSTCRECPAGCGISARTREGRLVKLEGSPDSPVGQGALCPAGQAAIEGLYSPSRMGLPSASQRALTWQQGELALAAGLKAALESGREVLVLTRPEPGRLGELFASWLTALGQSSQQVVTFDPMDRDWLREGQARAFGTVASPVYELSAAKVLVSIGEDFVEESSPVELARGFAQHRTAGGRSFYIGPRLSLTAAATDEWVSVEPGSELVFVLGLLRRVLELGSGAALAPGVLARLRERVSPFDFGVVAARTHAAPAVLEKVARALLANQPSLCMGPGRAVAGKDAAVLAEAVYVLNAVLGNLGRTLHFLPEPSPRPGIDMAELVRRASSGRVGALVVHHADPLGYGPLQAPFASALAKIPFVVAFGNELDATASQAHLVLPDHHFLESWSDVPVRAGARAVQQPVMSPVQPTRCAADELLGAARALGKAQGLPGGSFEEFVKAAYSEREIELGVQLTSVPSVSLQVSGRALAELPAAVPLRGPSAGLPVVLVPSFRSRDGRAPRSALLQELPDPLSGYSWTGWVELHPDTAAALNIASGDLVSVEGIGGHVELPAFVSKVIRPGVLGVPVSDALALLDSEATIGLGLRATARPTGKTIRRAHAEPGGSQHGRELVKTVSWSLPVLKEEPRPPSMYPEIEHPNHRWGLAIDLDLCTGCSACTAACYIENNLPVVGGDQVSRGRSMSWLPVQAFLEERAGIPEASFLPLSCQHCTAAPCEVVCPTFATYHTPEGLNAQVYARCIGTRYCENNCPYGVRRFNFQDVARPPPTHLGQNPDVTVRGRGVSEKCTLCVQRVRGAEEQAKSEGRPIRDGEFASACAAACPTSAITFGDLKDPGSKISKLAADGRSYRLLEQLNTQPGVHYLARRRGGRS